jgi:prepilin-type N-terminal cleavage/methylation domain-containing protein
MKKQGERHCVVCARDKGCKSSLEIRNGGEKGFTSIELIIVIVVLSILTASIIIKNPFSVSDYGNIAADQLIADIRYVQLKAMAVNNSQTIIFTVGSTGYNAAGLVKRLPGDITVLSITTLSNPLTFNSLGEPTSSGAIRLSGGREINVYAATGRAE